MVFFLGVAFLVAGIVIFLWNAFRLLRRTRVLGTLERIEEASSIGLSDSQQRLVIRYKDLQSKTQHVSTKARVTIGWISPGETVPVYITKDNTSPIVGGFVELWMWPAVLMGVGGLCLMAA